MQRLKGWLTCPRMETVESTSTADCCQFDDRLVALLRSSINCASASVRMKFWHPHKADHSYRSPDRGSSILQDGSQGLAPERDGRSVILWVVVSSLILNPSTSPNVCGISLPFAISGWLYLSCPVLQIRTSYLVSLGSLELSAPQPLLLDLGPPSHECGARYRS